MGTGSAERDAEEERRRRRRRLLVALNASPDLSRDAICRLARRTDAWGEGSGARPRELSRELGVSPGQLKAARRVRRSAARLARPELERAAGLGVAVLTLDDAAYPAELFDLELPPPVLYLRGRLPARPAVAIVGSRKADPYALEAATAFARELAHAGLAIVSGLALGVDGAAHRGALEADGGRTLAVQACGADRVHPWRHTRLADRIAETGAVLTEFPFDTPPYPSHFPIRNRIIAALAEGTLVVQAARRSGTLITARLALELGREVWAIPGSIYRQRAVGANELLRDGAAIVLEPRDVLESLPLGVRDRGSCRSGSRPSTSTSPRAACIRCRWESCWAARRGGGS